MSKLLLKTAPSAEVDAPQHTPERGASGLQSGGNASMMAAMQGGAPPMDPRQGIALTKASRDCATGEAALQLAREAAGRAAAFRRKDPAGAGRAADEAIAHARRADTVLDGARAVLKEHAPPPILTQKPPLYLELEQAVSKLALELSMAAPAIARGMNPASAARFPGGRLSDWLTGLRESEGKGTLKRELATADPAPTASTEQAAAQAKQDGAAAGHRTAGPLKDGMPVQQTPATAPTPPTPASLQGGGADGRETRASGSYDPASRKLDLGVDVQSTDGLGGTGKTGLTGGYDEKNGVWRLGGSDEATRVEGPGQPLAEEDARKREAALRAADPKNQGGPQAVPSRKASKTTTAKTNADVALDTKNETLEVAVRQGRRVEDDAGAANEREQTWEKERQQNDREKRGLTTVKARDVGGRVKAGAKQLELGADASQTTGTLADNRTTRASGTVLLGEQNGVKLGASDTVQQDVSPDGKKQDTTATTGNLAITDQGVAADGQHQTVKTDEASGDKTTKTVKGSADFTGGKQQIALRGAKRKTDAKGRNARGVDGGGSVDLAAGSAKADVTWAATGADGKPKASVTGKAGIRTQRDQGKGIGGDLEAAVSAGPVTFSAGGGYDFIVHVPKQARKGWVVLVEEKSHAKAGGGVKTGMGGGEVDLQHASAGSRSFNFSSFKEALAFYKRDHARSLAPPKSAADAEKMAEGDTAKASTRDSVTAGASANLGAVEVGISVQRARESGIEIQREAGDYVVVKVNRRAIDAYGGKLGTLGAGLSIGSSEDVSKSYWVRFDLKKHGKQFEAFVASKGAVLPKRGFKVLGSAETTRKTDTMSAKLLGLQVGQSGFEEHTKEERDGKKITSSTGGESSSVSMVGMGDYAASDQLKAVDVNGEERIYVGTTTIAASDAADTQKKLGRATDSKIDPDQEGDSGRTFKVTSLFSESQMDRFMDKVRKGEGNRAGISTGGDYEDLQARLLVAGESREAQHIALAKYMKEHGEKGLALMREMGGAPEQHLQVKGDPNFPGLAGKLALDAKIAGWREQLGSKDADYKVVKRAIGREIGALDLRRRRVSDTKKYPELPPKMREQEVSRIETSLKELRGLYATARGQMALDRKVRKKARKSRVATKVDHLKQAEADKYTHHDSMSMEGVDSTPVECADVSEETFQEEAKAEVAAEEEATTGKKPPTPAEDKALVAGRKAVASARKRAERLRNRARGWHDKAYRKRSEVRPARQFSDAWGTGDRALDTAKRLVEQALKKERNARILEDGLAESAHSLGLTEAHWKGVTSAWVGVENKYREAVYCYGRVEKTAKTLFFPLRGSSPPPDAPF